MSSLDKFIELFNTANNVSPPLGTLELNISNPRDMVPVDGRNAQVAVTGRLKMGFVGSVVFDYRRIDIGALFNGYQVVAYLKPGIATTRDAVASINAQFGLDIPKEDVEAILIQGDSATLSFTESSYKWTGSLPIKIVRSMTSLGELFVDDRLDGFTYPSL